MKLIIKLLLILVIGAVAAPLFIKGPDGQPLMQVSDLIPAEVLPETLVKTLGISPSSTTSQTSSPPSSSTQSGSAIYRWQDDNGQWHYSDKAPAHTQSESVTLQPVNTVPALKSQPQQSGNTANPLQSDAKAPDSATDLLSKLPDSLNPADTAALLEQAKETQRIIQERQAQIDALMKNQ
ncbi:DUF4124 domain-containing protein [Oceanospirillum sanctuarii]|uniref:DUF4124 domain-containing protein n=1 Tax=Oceanospirillum sanctuarii TaxID=1434821 RepID=UPI000A3BA06D|nr:DUF4124 domain-containing protein [Oceanospirillum sanctuarii]